MSNSKYKSARYRKAGRSLNGPEATETRRSTGLSRTLSFAGASIGGFIAGMFYPRASFPFGLATALGGNFIKPENGRAGVVGFGTGMAIAGATIRGIDGATASTEAKTVLLAKLTGKDLSVTPAALAIPATTTPADNESSPPQSISEIVGLGNIRYLSFQHSTPNRTPEPEFAGLEMFSRDFERHGQELVEEAMRRQALKENAVVASYPDEEEEDGQY